MCEGGISIRGAETIWYLALIQVMYNTLGRFLSGESDLTSGQVLKGFGIFIGVFIGSVAFGSIIGFIAVLIYRTEFFRSEGAEVHIAKARGNKEDR